MLPDLLSVALGLALPPVYAWVLIFRLLRFSPFRFTIGWLPGAVCGDAAAIVSRDWPYAAGATASAAVALVIWWWRRRKDRRRVLAAIGSKARALRDAIVKRARDASRGARPVLRPVHGGAS